MPVPSRPGTTPRSFRCVLGCCLSSLVLVASGCDQASTPGEPAEAIVLPTPEERFEAIVTTLKQKLENDQLSGLNATTDYNAPAGTPVTAAKVRVDHELSPPTAEGEPYRGVVLLSTKATVTVVLPEPTDEEAAESAAKRNARMSQLEEDLEGVGDLDTLVSPSAGRVASSPIHEIKPDDTASRFELEYRDERWQLVSELDRENEPFYAVAIEYALNRQ